MRPPRSGVAAGYRGRARLASGRVKQRHLGRSGLVVSRLALGTMTWGRDTDEDDAAAQLVAFREAGGTLVDTADVYAGGASETVLGRLLADVVPRDEVLVATKAYGQTGSGPMGRGTSRGHLLSALDASLDAARHRPRRPVAAARLGPGDAVGGGDGGPRHRRRVRSGPLRRRLELLGLAARRDGDLAARLARSRARSSATRSSTRCCSAGVEREVVPAAAGARRRAAAVVAARAGACSPASTATAPPPTAAARRRTSRRSSRRTSPPSAGSVVDAVLTAADGLGVSPVAVALAWVRDRPGVVAPIVGARTSAQLQASLAAETVELPPEIRRALDDVSAPTLGYPERLAPLAVGRPGGLSETRVLRPDATAGGWHHGRVPYEYRAVTIPARRDPRAGPRHAGDPRRVRRLGADPARRSTPTASAR